MTKDITDIRDILVLKGVYDGLSLRVMGKELHTSYENVRLIVERMAREGFVIIDEAIVRSNNRSVTQDGLKGLKQWKLI